MQFLIPILIGVAVEVVSSLLEDEDDCDCGCGCDLEEDDDDDDRWSY